jgi:hypothetical protein
MNKITLSLFAALGIMPISGSIHAKDILQTIETEHARIHFHQDYRAFAQQVASKFEPIYDDVSLRVGFEQNDKLDFLIGDDFHQANGYAIPFAAGKIVKVFTSSPRSEEALGSYNDWLDIVISHELTHKIQMSAPSRSWRSSLDSTFLTSDLINFFRYPRWVTEGYATVIETEYTKQGRVNSDYIKALLQQWAIEGQLPSYEALNGSSSYEGNRMAYYQGSAFLSWLKESYGQKKLQQLWKRSTAKKYRNFEDAFSGLFLSSPQILYKEFVAEQTYAAKQNQFAKQSKGKLWQNNAFSVISSEPSPAQNQVMQVEIDKEGFAQLNVFSLDENTKAKEEFVKNNDELLSEDSQDVADSMPVIFNRDATHTVTPAKHMRWRHARWLGDNHALVLQALQQDNNEFGFELAKVELATGEVTKITKSLRLHDFAITPDQKSVIATSHFAGFNQIIKVSLFDGSFEVLDEKRLNQPMDNLTLSPDGETLALMAIHDKQWKIHFYHLITKKWQAVELPIEGSYTSHLRWQKDGLFFSQSHSDEMHELRQGIKSNVAIDVYRLKPKEKTWQQLTQGRKLVTNAFTINDQLIYLSTSSQGQDTYSQVINEKLSNSELSSGNFELLTFDKPVPKINLASDLPTKDYGIGPQTGLMTLITGYDSKDDSGTDIVFRGGDPLGRLRWQAAITSGTQQEHRSFSVKSNWQSAEWFAEFIDRAYKNDGFNRDNQLINVNVAKTFTVTDNSRFKMQFGLGRDEANYFSENQNDELSDEINHYRLQGEFGHGFNLGKVDLGFSLNAAFIDYESDQQEKQSWKRNNYGLGAFVNHGRYSFQYHYQDSKVDENTPFYALLSQGGQLTTTTSQVLNSHQADSRVPLAWQIGFHFKQHNVEVELHGLTLFYLKNEADDNDSLAAYGVELKVNNERNMTPLIDGLTVQLGYSWYEEKNIITNIVEDESQLYVTATYQFK